MKNHRNGRSAKKKSILARFWAKLARLRRRGTNTENYRPRLEKQWTPR